MQQLIAGLLEVSRRPNDRGRVCHVKLDADLRYRPLCRPSVATEARVSGLGERPDPERLAACDLLAVVIPVTLALQRESQRIDIQAAAVDRIGSDHGHGREELDVHGTSSLVAAQ